MSTPAPIVFTPFTKSITWVDALTDSSGRVLPQGEVLADTVLGVRADGDSAHSPGDYAWTGTIAAPVAAVTPASLNTALGVVLQPGNYWLAARQTDTLNGQSATSVWSPTETPFSVPEPIVTPSNPTNFVVS